MKIKIVCLIFIKICTHVAPFQFEDPQQPGVEFVNVNSQIQIFVDENNNGGRTKVIRITEVQDELQLIRILATNQDDILEVKLEADDSDYVVTANLLDYDKLMTDGIYTQFFLGIQEGTDKEYFTVDVKNIDDERPTLEESLCSMEEETIIDVNISTCRFNATDPDGWLKDMHFTIDGYLGDIFELQYKEVPDDKARWSYVYMVLKDDKILDYESVNSYSIPVKATDAARHSTDPQTITLLILVRDKPPVWTDFPSIKHIDEETNTSFVIAATDADTNSNHQVSYRMYDPSGLVTLDPTSGKITIISTNGKPDREKGFENFYLQVTAFYSESPTVSTFGEITFMIDDIDDNAAIIDGFEKTEIVIPEKSKMVSFYISAVDLDLGENSNYTIDLEVPDKQSSAFDFSPKIGSEITLIEITVNSTQLSLVDPQWNNFQIELKTTGAKTKENTDTLSITVYRSEGNSSMSDLRITWMMLFLIISVKMTHL